jgi:hypothetical protein
MVLEFACEAKGPPYTFRLLNEQTVLTFLYFPMYVLDCSNLISPHSACCTTPGHVPSIRPGTEVHPMVSSYSPGVAANHVARTHVRGASPALTGMLSTMKYTKHRHLGGRLPEAFVHRAYGN